MFSEIVLHDWRRPVRARLDARRFAGPYRWRPAAPNTGRGFYQSARALAMDPAGSSFALRLEDAGDHYRGAQTYRADDWSGAEYRGIVARLPRGRGFLAGFTMGAGMLAGVGAAIFADAADAAADADEQARIAAEREQEEQEADGAGQIARAKGRDARDACAAWVAIVRDFRRVRAAEGPERTLAPAFVDRMRRARERFDDARADYHAALDDAPRGALAGAFWRGFRDYD